MSDLSLGALLLLILGAIVVSLFIRDRFMMPRRSRRGPTTDLERFTTHFDHQIARLQKITQVREEKLRDDFETELAKVRREIADWIVELAFKCREPVSAEPSQGPEDQPIPRDGQPERESIPASRLVSLREATAEEGYGVSHSKTEVDLFMTKGEGYRIDRGFKIIGADSEE